MARSHIPGAVAFPSGWLRSVDGAEVERLLTSKGITRGREIVLYGDRKDVAAVAARLEELGHRSVRRYEDWPEWAADESLPLERLPSYDKLVHPEWLRQVLDGGEPEAPPDGRFLPFHVNFGVPEEYEENHLPGAIYLDTNSLESSVDWNRRSPEELAAALRSLGITRDTSVVLYGRDTEGDANEKWPGRRAGRSPRPVLRRSSATAASTTSGCSTVATTAGSGRAIRSRRFPAILCRRTLSAARSRSVPR